MVRILGFYCHGSGSISGQGTEIPGDRDPTRLYRVAKKKKVNTFDVTENTNFARTNSGYKIIYLRISFNISADHEE